MTAEREEGHCIYVFTPVLGILLRRFENDVQRDVMVKVNSPYSQIVVRLSLYTGIIDGLECPFEFDVVVFTDDSADKSQSWVYKPHAVLDRSGNIRGGQSFALTKPDENSQWLKFDDDRESLATDREVPDDDYGGEVLNGIHSTVPIQVLTGKRFTNAYMLVYTHESAITEIDAPFAEDDTPAKLCM